jgi:hypothetical protein
MIYPPIHSQRYVAETVNLLIKVRTRSDSSAGTGSAPSSAMLALSCRSNSVRE